jgi:hypothetical protein
MAQTRNPERAQVSGFRVRARGAPRNDGIEQARDAGLFCFGPTCAIEGGQPGDGGEPAMRIRIGAMTLMAVLAIGDAGTIGIASAAKVITVPRQTKFVPARTHHVARQDRASYGPYDRGYDGAWTYYYGRPYFYAPAPFPLGFDFGFGWW